MESSIKQIDSRNGKIYAMTVVTLPHNYIALNLYSALRSPMRTKGCRVNVADARLGITEKGPFVYPDLLVTCDPRDRQAIEFVQFPCCITEVLSPSTEAYNRGGKFAPYCRLESLREYVLISSESLSVEIFRLNDRNKWELTPYAAGEEIEFTSLNLTLPIELLYEDVDLTPQEAQDAGIGA